MPVIKGENISNSEHWNGAFESVVEDKLGWFETDFTPSLDLLDLTGLPTDARIVIAGAGTTHLLDELIQLGYVDIVATDISKVAHCEVVRRLGDKLDYIIDDLTNPVALREIGPVDFWFDRAVLHFFTSSKAIKAYQTLINHQVKDGGYVVLAEFAEDGATMCSGLNLRRYSVEEMGDFLGDDFTLQNSFRHIYTMPSGGLRPYNYALFRKIKELE